jgi:nucleolar protein 56
MVEPLTCIVGEETKARGIFEMSKASVGEDISPLDDINIAVFTNRIALFIKYRRRLDFYVATKMYQIAPNLTSLVGVMFGARLVSHAGSLINLAKYSASSQRIIGSENTFFKTFKSTDSQTRF